MKHIHAVIDLQFGSTGKGSLAALLAHNLKADTAITSWGPNAGHTSYDVTGNKYVHMMVANSLTMGAHTQLVGPGSALNMELMLSELMHPALTSKRIIVHPNAAVVTQAHRDHEAELVRIGSTMKGTAAALIDKLWRDASHRPLARHWFASNEGRSAVQFVGQHNNVVLVCDEEQYDEALENDGVAIMEGAQGFSLGIHTQFWPHTTSRDISIAQMIADCRVPWRAAWAVSPWGVCRTYPIRVANRYKDGAQVGASGGCYEDQHEIEWSSIGREPELTTVTKLPRRLFTFSDEQIRQACRINQPDHVMLTFCDYVCDAPPKTGYSKVPAALAPYIERINRAAEIPVLRLLSFGPTMDDVYTYNWRTNMMMPGWALLQDDLFGLRNDRPTLRSV